MIARSLFLLLLPLIISSIVAQPATLVPEIDGPWWTIARDPDLGSLTAGKQQPVDFAIWQASDGTWQLCSCIRGTKEPGNTRVLFQWEGSKLTDRDWKAMGIAMHADATVGETPGGLQAPFVFKDQNRFVMFFGDWQNICMAESGDGKTFTRRVNADGKTGMFSQGAGNNTRDPMVLRIGQLWYCYYAAYPDRHCAVYCRTSSDFAHWSEGTKVAAGGEAGAGPWSAECPFVVHIAEMFYLFRTQQYGEHAITRVYASRDPLTFGIDNDRDHLIASLPIAAPEIFQYEGQWYIAALRADLKGIQLARLQWQSRP